jgi:hypothetical protein
VKGAGGRAGLGAGHHQPRGQPAAADRAAQLRVGGHLAARPDDAAQRPAWTSARPPRSPSPARPGPRRLHTCNLDGFAALYRGYRGGRPPTFTLAQRRQVKQLALSRPVDHDLPFSTWSLAKLSEFLVAEGRRRPPATRPAAPALGRRACPFNGSSPESSPATQTSRPRTTASCTGTPDGRHRRRPAGRPRGGGLRR